MDMPLLSIDINNELSASEQIPSHADFSKWLNLAYAASYNSANGNAAKGEDNDVYKDGHNHHQPRDAEVCLSLVSASQIQSLNAKYRDKDKATNVLSFAAEIAEEHQFNFLGDIIICADVVKQEAKAQNKALMDHWAHLSIHGCLHLLGYDHVIEQQAQQMESLEIALLEQLGIANPYAIT